MRLLDRDEGKITLELSSSYVIMEVVIENDICILDSFEMFCDWLHEIYKKGVKNDFCLFSLSKKNK